MRKSNINLFTKATVSIYGSGHQCQPFFIVAREGRGGHPAKMTLQARRTVRSKIITTIRFCLQAELRPQTQQ